MKSLLPGQLQKVLREAVGGTCSRSVRGLGEGSVGPGRRLPSSPGARECREPKALVAEAGADAPGQAEGIMG